MVVDHNLTHRVVVHRVNREVAARSIFNLWAPDVVAQDAAGGVDDVGLVGALALNRFLVANHLVGDTGVQVGAKGRHLNHFMFAATTEYHVHQTETPTDDEGTAK